MPVAIGDRRIQADSPSHRVFSLDARDLMNVRVVSSLSFDERQRPHWPSTDGSRIVMMNEPGPAAFRDAGSSRPAISRFGEADWPGTTP